MDSDLSHIPQATPIDLSLLEPFVISDKHNSIVELNQFKEEYQKLQLALRKSHDSENRFVNKCRTLSKQIQNNSDQLVTLISITSADEEKRTKLQILIREKSDKVKSLKYDTEDCQAKIKAATHDLSHLVTQLEKGQFESVLKAEAEIQELKAVVEQLTESKDFEMQKLTSLRSKSIALITQKSELHETERKARDELSVLDMKVYDFVSFTTK